MVEDLRRSLAFHAECLAGRVGRIGVQRDEPPVGHLGARATSRHAQRTEGRDRVPVHHAIVALRLDSGNGLGRLAGRTEVVTLSWWDDLDVIRAFAGDDIETARYYPEDDEYLVERETTVAHFEVAEPLG